MRIKGSVFLSISFLIVIIFSNVQGVLEENRIQTKGEQNYGLNDYEAVGTYLGLDGSTYTLQSQYEGNYLLIDAFATWCVPCRKATADIQKLQDLNYNLSIISVSVSPSTDTINVVKNYKAEHNIDWEIGIDVNNSFDSFFQIAVIPTLVLVDPTGKILYQQQGVGDTSDEKLIDNVRINLGEQASSSFSIQNQNLLLTLAALLGVGLLTSFSPCLFPLMPTYLSLLSSEKNSATKSKQLLSILSLGIGIFIVFAGLTLLYSFSLHAIFSIFLNQYIVFAIIQGSILILLGILTIFTPKFITNIKMPDWLNEKVTKEQANPIFSSFLIGLFYTVIAAPCALSYFIFSWTALAAFNSVLIQVIGSLIFTLGTLIPFFILALFIPKLKATTQKRIHKGSTYFKYIIGFILFCSGIWLITQIYI